MRMKQYATRYISLAGLAVAILFNTTLHAKILEIPLALKHPLLSQLISEQLFISSNKTLRVADDGSGCQYLELSKPKTASYKQLLRIRADGYARLGTAWNNQCILLWEWRGQVELIERLSVIDNGNQIKAKVVESRLLTPQGQIDNVNNTLWQWLSQFLQPAFEQVIIDIKQPLNETRAVMAQTMVNLDRELMEKILNSIKITSLDVDEVGIAAKFSISLPEAVTPLPEPARALTQKEIDLLEESMRHLDGFITFIAKHLAVDTQDLNIKRDLLNVLLEARYDLLGIAVAEKTDYRKDPVKKVFLDTWHNLMPVMRKIADQQQQSSIAINYLSFISAGEALSLMDELGPHIGVDISVDGLRRLARVLVHETKEDPVAYSQEIDKQLRKIFGFGEPIRSEAPLPRSLLDWFIKPGWAGVDPAILKKLNNSLPRKNEMKNYLNMVNSVLSFSAQQQIRETDLEQSYQQIFRNLVLATAWQETCWRQYINNKGMRMPITSKQGDVGLMQVNLRVWRGFYSVHNIKWDIAYNAKAGTEILYHYFNDYALRKEEHKKTGKLENLARASYSAFNGGPKSLTRYRNNNTVQRLKQVDAKFYEKYNAIKKGDYTAVLSCY